MLALSQSRFLRLLTFGALYFAQGIPWGFISVGYVIFLADQGLDNEAVGKAIGLAYIPWSFKILWGPLIDRFPSIKLGRRRHFIIASELLMGLTLLWLLGLDPKTQLETIGIALFLHNTFAALQDVAVDALAVDLLEESERGTANSIMWAGKSAGVAAGGGAGTVLAKYMGWPALFIAMTVILWAIMLIPILVRERPRGEKLAGDGRLERLELRELWRSFNFATPWLGVLVAVFTPFGYALIGVFSTRMFRADLKLSEEAIATLSGVVDPVAGVCGALVGGIVADRIGLKRGIGLFMVGIAVSIAAFGLLPQLWPSFAFLVVYTAVLQFCINAYNAATLGLFMSISNPAVGATQFAVFMAATNFSYALTAPAGGWMADHWGYVPSYLAAAAIQLLTIALLPLVDLDKARARFRAAPEAVRLSEAEG